MDSIVQGASQCCVSSVGEDGNRRPKYKKISKDLSNLFTVSIFITSIQ